MPSRPRKQQGQPSQDLAALTPLVSIIIVAYRSQRDLERCLPTLPRNQGIATEVIVVDNEPEGKTAAWLSEHYPDLRVLKNSHNSGYAGGNNLALRCARGHYILVLNPDTELTPGALTTLLSAAKTYPKALITAKLLKPDGRVNACGNEMNYTGITACRGLDQHPDAYRGIGPVPLLSGAAFMAPRDVLLDLGGFAEEHFMYHEDVDLSLRAKLRGYPLLCAHEAIITHHYTLGMSSTKFYFLERNRLLTLFRILERRTLIKLIPALLLTELATWCFALLRGPAYMWARGRGYRWLWRNKKQWCSARQEIQSTRRVSDAKLLEDSLASLPFTQLTPHRQLSTMLTAVVTPMYQLLRPRLKGTT